MENKITLNSLLPSYCKKYKGCTFKEAIEKDIQYVEWIVNKYDGEVCLYLKEALGENVFNEISKMLIKEHFDKNLTTNLPIKIIDKTNIRETIVKPFNEQYGEVMTMGMDDSYLVRESQYTCIHPEWFHLQYPFWEKRNISPVTDDFGFVYMSTCFNEREGNSYGNTLAFFEKERSLQFYCGYSSDAYGFEFKNFSIHCDSMQTAHRIKCTMNGYKLV